MLKVGGGNFHSPTSFHVLYRDFTFTFTCNQSYTELSGRLD